MPDKKYTKVEEEIIQILDRLEDERPAQPRKRPDLRVVSSNPRPQARPKRQWSLARLPAWWPVAGALGLALAAILVRDSSRTLAVVLSILAIVAFLSPIVLRRGGSAPPSTPSSPFGTPGTKTWRGRDITLGPPAGDAPAERAKRWITYQRRRFRR